jgi:hypothetical protein
MSTKLVIRHSKTDANRLTRTVYGDEGAPLNSRAPRSSFITVQLINKGIDPAKEVAGVSEFNRTAQTAREAGFVHIKARALLNEAKTNDPASTQLLIAKSELSAEALAAAKAIIDNPPQEFIWVTWPGHRSPGVFTGHQSATFFYS